MAVGRRRDRVDGGGGGGARESQGRGEILIKIYTDKYEYICGTVPSSAALLSSPLACPAKAPRVSAVRRSLMIKAHTRARARARTRPRSDPHRSQDPKHMDENQGE